MLDIDVDFDVSEFSAATVHLNFALTDGVRSFRKWLLGPCTTITLDNIRRQFLTEGRRFGSQWQGLSKWTQRVRTQRGYGAKHPILRQSSRLFDMATSRGNGAKITATEDHLNMDFSAVPYGDSHLTGMTATRSIPVRRWLPPDEGTPAMRRELEVALAHELERRAAYNLRRRARRAEARD